jgi:hypothetical protein
MTGSVKHFLYISLISVKIAWKQIALHLITTTPYINTEVGIKQ